MKRRHFSPLISSCRPVCMILGYVVRELHHTAALNRRESRHCGEHTAAWRCGRRVFRVGILLSIVTTFLFFSPKSLSVPSSSPRYLLYLTSFPRNRAHRRPSIPKAQCPPLNSPAKPSPHGTASPRTGTRASAKTETSTGASCKSRVSLASSKALLTSSS